MPRNTLGYSGREYDEPEEKQYDAEHFRDRNLDPREDNNLLLEAYREACLEARENQYGEESREDPGLAEPARALEFAKDLSLAHWQEISGTRGEILNLLRTGQRERQGLMTREDAQARRQENRMNQFAQDHPDDWENRWNGAHRGSVEMIQAGEHLAALGFTRTDPDALAAGRKLLQQGSCLLEDTRADERLSDYLMWSQERITWYGSHQESQDRVEAIMERMEWAMGHGDVPEKYQDDVWPILVGSAVENLETEHRWRQDDLLREAGAAGIGPPGLAEILSYTQDEFEQNGGQEAFRQAQAAMLRHDARTAAQQLELPRQHQETTVGIAFALDRCREELPDELALLRREAHSHLYAWLDGREGREETQESLQGLLDELPAMEGSNGSGETVNGMVERMVERVLRERCLREAQEALETLGDPPEDTGREDLFNSTYRKITNAVELSAMLQHGGIAHYVDIAKANPGWEPFLRNPGLR